MLMEKESSYNGGAGSSRRFPCSACVGFHFIISLPLDPFIRQKNITLHYGETRAGNIGVKGKTICRIMTKKCHFSYIFFSPFIMEIKLKKFTKKVVFCKLFES